MNLSEEQICNAALGFVGAGKILNLSEGSVESEACLRHWPIVRQYVFESHPWKCISRQASLTTTTTEPLFGYAYAYPVPTDFVRMIGADEQDGKYKLYNRVLHTDESPANLDYVFLCTDGTRYTAGLVLSLELHLGYFLALDLRHDPDLAARMIGDLERFFLPIIRHADASGQGVRTMQQSTLTDLFR